MIFEYYGGPRDGDREQLPDGVRKVEIATAHFFQHFDKDDPNQWLPPQPTIGVYIATSPGRLEWQGPR